MKTHISKEQYNSLKAIDELYQIWLNTSDKVKRSRSGMLSYNSHDVPDHLRLTNEQRSAIEVYEFITDPPIKYFAYVNSTTQKITTWTGEKLGDIVAKNRSWTSNLGDRRKNLTIKAINGKMYYGTYYYDSGDYVRMKQYKKNPKTV